MALTSERFRERENQEIIDSFELLEVTLKIHERSNVILGLQLVEWIILKMQNKRRGKIEYEI